MVVFHRRGRRPKTPIQFVFTTWPHHFNDSVASRNWPFVGNPVRKYDLKRTRKILPLQPAPRPAVALTRRACPVLPVSCNPSDEGESLASRIWHENTLPWQTKDFSRCRGRFPTSLAFQTLNYTITAQGYRLVCSSGCNRPPQSPRRDRRVDLHTGAFRS